MLLLQHPRTQDGELVGLGQIEVQARTLIDHVRIEALRTQQADPGGQFLTLRNQHIKLGLQVRNLALDPRPANKPELPIQRMKAEIGKNSGCDGRNDQAAKKRLLSLTSGGWHDSGPNNIQGWSDSIMGSCWLRES